MFTLAVESVNLELLSSDMDAGLQGFDMHILQEAVCGFKQACSNTC
jgi:hypothetical protein